jgi:16S rRNA processing protein RimM
MVVVGRVARTHGLRGEVAVEPETDFPEARFAPGKTVYAMAGTAMRALVIEHVREHKGRPLVTFEGVESIEAAEALGRAELRVPLEDLEALPPGQYRHLDLVGCAVETAAGEAVGRVLRVEGAATSSRLVVGGARGEVLVPLAAEICVSIDPAAGRIVIAPPDGLLDLNA